MKRLAVIAIFTLLLLPTGEALGAPGGAETPPSPGAGPADADKPPPDRNAQDPDARPGADKPPADRRADGGQLPGAGDPFGPGAKKKWPDVMYGLGASFQFVMVPHFFLKAFTVVAKNDSYGLYDFAGGLHFVRRKKLMDMTVRLMFGRYKLLDGNWLGAGHDMDEMDYVEFHNMNFVWIDITWTWHTRLAKQFYLAYGVGVGIGYVTGKVYTTPSYTNGNPATPCTTSNYSDARSCHPAGIVGTECTRDGCPRSLLQNLAEREHEKSVPPVLPAINGLIGLRYDFFRHLTARLDTGIFLPGLFYVQFGITAMF